MFRKAVSFPPEERLSFMASGRRVGGDVCNLVVREEKFLAFRFFLAGLRIENILQPSPSYMEKGIDRNQAPVFYYFSFTASCVKRKIAPIA